MMQAENNSVTATGDAGPHPAAQGQAPSLSIILPADRPESIRGVLEQLRTQSIASRLEVVVATAAPAAFAPLRASPDGLHSVMVVEVADLTSLGAARALAVRTARADCVFLGETHSFAGVPTWAQRLVERHREGWTVVVPGFRNANPGSLLSWVGFLRDYGGWTEQQPGGEIDYWPLNNACCDRAAILTATDDPAHALSYGDQLIVALRAAGHRVYLEPAATLSHLNIARLRPWLDERWVAGHLIAWERSRDWPLARRLAYACASPLIACVLFGRAWRPGWRTVRMLDLPVAILPAMLLATATQALGEWAGYARLGNYAASERRMTEYELHKASYV